MSITKTVSRVRFIACEGDDKALVGRTGFIISGGERRYTQAGFDSMVLLDAQPGDTRLREVYGAFEGCWFPGIEQWSKEKWRGRIVVEADSAEHLEVIGSAEVEPYLQISRRSGTEGPRHDPYSYVEWTLTLDAAREWKIHDGLGTWVRLNDKAVELSNDDIDEALRRSGCPLSLREIEQRYEEEREAPLKEHEPHGEPCWQDGFPGESLLTCPCGAVLDSTFDISAVE